MRWQGFYRPKAMSISEIENLVTEYQSLTRGMVDYAKYAYYAITHHSTAIEGSTLTENQVINLLEYGKTAPSKPFEHHQMAFDHYHALVFVAAEAAQQKTVTVRLIQDIAAKVMHGTGGIINAMLGTYDTSKGDLRLSSVRAGTRTFPDYKKVGTLLETFCAETNENIKKAETLEEKCKAAFKAHFDLVSIHPFGDGNGRTSRLIMNYLQAYFGLPLSVTYKEDRLKYIDALENARKKEDLQPFYDFMFQQYAKFLKKEIAVLKQ